MSIAQDLERLATLHRQGALSREEFTRAKARLLSAGEMPRDGFRGIRRQSSRRLIGLPLWAIAIGPDPERGEPRGHARGIFALGDIATGFVAVGGLARGILAIGGLAIGAIGLGGCAIGLLLAVGGGAIGSVAFGGAAVGYVAVGGGALGYYAMGGGAVGAHVISAAQQDPAAIAFFEEYFPWLMEILFK